MAETSKNNITTSPIGVFTTDVNLRITSWNDWLSKATGMDEESVRGSHITKVIPDLEQRGLLERFHRVITDGVVELITSVFHRYLIRIPFKTPVGNFTEMQQRVTISPLSEEETIHGTLVTIEDVTCEPLKEIDQNADSYNLTSLSSEDWKERGTIVKNLSSAGNVIVSEVLKKIKLEHGNMNILSSAMKVISLSDEDVSSILIDFLNGEDSDLRIYAAQMLGTKNTHASVEALTAVLDDPDANVAYHAIESLGKLRAFQAVDKLADIAISRKFFTAFPAIDALREIGDARASKLIAPLIQDNMLGQPVADALAELGEADIAPVLVNEINRNSLLLTDIVQALARIAERYQDTLGEGSYIADITRSNISRDGIRNLLSKLDDLTGKAELSSMIKILGWIDDKETQIALTRYLGNQETRKQVIDAFVSSGTKVVDLLISQLGEDTETRHAAIMALGRIGGDKAGEALTVLLRNDEDAVLCCSAIARIGDRRAYDELICLIGHENASIRFAAISALNSIGHPDMPRRINILLADKNPLVRESALRIAGYFGFPESRSIVQKLCSDMDQSVRVAAIESLPSFEDDRMVSLLRCFYSDEDPKIRAAVVKSLGRMESVQAHVVLSQALNDNDPWVRYYAVKSLDQLNITDMMDRIKDIILNDPAPFVRLAAIEYLSHTGGKIPVSILASLTGDETFEIALASVKALGNIHHPDSLPPLIAFSRSDHNEIRKAAIEALGHRGGDGIAALLQWTALTEKDPAIKASAIKGLRLISTGESINALLNLTADSESREKAIYALSTLPSSELHLLSPGLKHKKTLVRTAVVEVLQRIHTPEASKMLSECLSNDDVAVRLATVYALHRLGSRSHLKQLLELKFSDPDPTVKKAVEDILTTTKETT
jgi:PAS domain S-box-containing protein